MGSGSRTIHSSTAEWSTQWIFCVSACVNNDGVLVLSNQYNKCLALQRYWTGEVSKKKSRENSRWAKSTKIKSRKRMPTTRRKKEQTSKVGQILPLNLWRNGTLTRNTSLKAKSGRNFKTRNKLWFCLFWREVRCDGSSYSLTFSYLGSGAFSWGMWAPSWALS